MTIEPVSIHDAAAIHRIAQQNGLPASWSWPTDCHGGVAKDGEAVVAFTAVKEIFWETPFLAVEEYWCEHSPTGRQGLLELGEAIERIAQDMATAQHLPVKAGGFISYSKPDHAKALKKRGYIAEGELLTKAFYPEAKAEVA